MIAVTAAATFALAGTTAGIALAASPDSFNAPMLGTTATLTEARMPSYAQVHCSDATCTTGVITRAAGGFTQYLSPSIAPGGAFATVPGFLAKLNKSWTSATEANTKHYSTMTINFAQFSPGTDLAAAVASDASTMDLTLAAPTTSGSSTIWLASGSTDDSSSKVAYVANGDSIARGFCIQYGNERGSATCAPDHVQQLAQGVIDTPAASTLAESRSVTGLIPATPKGLTPVLLNIEPTVPLWAANAPGAALERALGARKNSVALQYAVKGNPALMFTSKVAALSSQAPALPFVKTICESNAATTRSCTLSRVPGKNVGYIGSWSRNDDPAQVDHLAMHVTGAKKLGDAVCAIPGKTTRGLTAKEIAACRAALLSFASAAMK